jgi:hypothetical protein
MSDSGSRSSSTSSSLSSEDLKLRGQVVAGLVGLYTKHLGQEFEKKASHFKEVTIDTVIPRGRSYSTGDVPPGSKDIR